MLFRSLSFELGLLWPEFMELAGPYVALPFSLEGFAFFFEAVFLGADFFAVDFFGAARAAVRLAGAFFAAAFLAAAFFVAMGSLLPGSVETWMMVGGIVSSPRRAAGERAG